MSRQQLQERIGEIIAAGRGRLIDEIAFVPLLELESERWYGLDGDVRSVAANLETGIIDVFQPGHEKVLLELLEHKRREFEQKLTEAAAEYDLPLDPLLLAVPAVELVRAALAMESTYYRRLALMWLLPTELRDLREDIRRTSEDQLLPMAIRDLATHLVVPE